MVMLYAVGGKKQMTDYRIERDSMGEMQVPANSYYGAQTQRAVLNFPISGIRFLALSFELWVGSRKLQRDKHGVRPP